MSTKAIFAQCTELFLQVATYLKNNHNWEIQYIVGYDYIEQDVKRNFPKAIFHSTIQLKNGIFPPESDKFPKTPLDKELLAQLFRCESTVLKMLNRLDYNGNFTYQDRILYYHKLVMYWTGVLDYLLPDVVVFKSPPHHTFDFVLYTICRVYKIKTIMFERTIIPCVTYPVSSYEFGSVEIRNFYNNSLKNHKESDNIDLSDSMSTYLDNLRNCSFHNGMPQHLKYKLSVYKKHNSSIITWGKYSYILCRDIIKGIMLSYRKTQFLKRKYHKNIAPFKKHNLKNYYNNLVKPIDLNEKYIFIALQCEPERQVSPSGDAFANQYLVVDTLSKLVPDDWMLYVKEHVSQFRSYQNVERAKNRVFYDYIASLRNTKLVSLDITSYELIDRSLACASVSGSVCWESVVRGKPALLFGYSWYGDCHGVFRSHYIDELKKAIQQIENGYHVDFDKVKLFVGAIEKHSIWGDVNCIGEVNGMITRGENVTNLSESINKYYQTY